MPIGLLSEIGGNKEEEEEDELFQALSRFSVLEATESWAGPGNEATRLARSLPVGSSGQGL